MVEGVAVRLLISALKTTGTQMCAEPWQHRCRHTGARESRLFDGAAVSSGPARPLQASLNPHPPAQGHRSCRYRGGDQGPGKGKGRVLVSWELCLRNVSVSAPRVCL